MKKLTIGIYGDSFAEDKYSPFHVQYDGWSKVLSKDPQFEVTNFAEAGSGLYFSYQNFIKSYKNFDKCVFIASNPSRHTIEAINPFTHTLDKIHFVPGFDNERYKEFPKNSEMFIKLKSLSDYTINIDHQDKDEVFGNLMLNDVLNKHSNVILISSVFISQNFNFDSDLCLYNISKKEQEFFNIKNDEIGLGKLFDARPNHISEENNFILYQEIKECLLHDKPFVLDINKYQNPSKNFNYYFKQK